MTEQNMIDQVARGLAAGEYSLLLGAGASVGAIGGNGRPLPTGTGLRDALISEFGIDSEGEILSLAQVYGHLQRHDGERANAFLRDWFGNCRPNWQHLIAEFSWKRIWTLNIDNVIETAFRETGRSVETLTWNERFSDRNSASGQQIIHLHGLAERLNNQNTNTDTLVFSLLDYAREVANPQTWHKVFFDEFAGNPFLIIGARLTEEIDLVEALDRGNTSNSTTGFPSVVVVPNINSIRREQLENSGFVIVESDGQDFIADLLERYRTVISELGNVYGPGTPGTRKFLQQFIDLRTYKPNDTNLGLFYSGYQPTWNTILAENDAILDKTSQISVEVKKLAFSSEVYQKLVFLTGGPGSGKSTALLRVAADLRSEGMFPFLFRGDEYIDMDSTIEWLQTVSGTVLFFDDFADHSSTLQILAERCREAQVRMLLIGADRSARHSMIEDRIGFQYLDSSEYHWYGRLTDDDIVRIIGKLQSRGRLGKITRWPSAEQHNYFVDDAARSLFDAMAELEGGLGFSPNPPKGYCSSGQMRD